MVLISELFDTIAVIAIIKLFICRVLPWIYRNTFGPMLFGSNIQLSDYKRWAVVTGVDNGIGAGYAQRMAELGLDVVLIGENKKQLDALAKQIGESSSVRIKVIDVNFNGDPKIYDRIRENLKDLDIGVLVNAVDTDSGTSEHFYEICDGQNAFQKIIHYNIESMLNLCYIVIPNMIQNGKGVIINVSSLFGSAPSPFFTLYGASKAFVHKFSEDLAMECKDHGIYVQSVLPGYLAPNKDCAGLFTPTVDTYINSAMKTIGYGTYNFGHWSHAIIRLFLHEVNFYSVSAYSVIMYYLKRPPTAPSTKSESCQPAE